MTFRTLFLFVFILIFQSMDAQVILNEFQTSNISTILSWDNQYREWLEIGNTGPYAINLQGYSLTTDLNDPDQQVLSTKWVDPGEFVLIRLARSGEETYGIFKPEIEGGFIGLFSPQGELVDSVTYPRQYADISYGRIPGMPEQWAWYPEPTPGSMNHTIAVEEDIPAGIVGFSLPAGFITGGQVLELFSSSEGAIRFTLDGSWPDESSDLYTGPLTLTRTCMVRARVFMESRIPGPIATRTYLVDESSTLPVVSLVTDARHFFDDRTGIYVKGTNGIAGNCMDEPVNWNQDWERPVNLEYFDRDGNPVVNQLVGVKIHGGCSRMWDFKSLALYARKKYGNNRLNCRFFQSKQVDEFKSLVLRNSGNDAYYSLLRDGFMQSIVEGQMDLDCQGYQPALVFINGEFWGILNVREKINEDYPASNYDFHNDMIDMLERDNYLLYNTTIYGSGEHYRELIEYVENNDLDVEEHYRYVQTQMDVNEYLNYFLSEIYFENEDWPRNNMKYWRPHTDNGRWRWVLFDTDFGWGLLPKSGNSLEVALTAGRSSLLMNSLLENEGFRSEFIQRMAGYINTTFEPDRVTAIYDSVREQLTAEIQRHMDRWGRPTSNSFVEQTEEVIPAFTANRPDIVRDLMMDWFGIDGLYGLAATVDDPAKGYIRASGVPLPDHFSGEFFNDVPLRLEAVPASGYAFSHWEGDGASQDAEFQLITSGNASVHAVFRQAEPVEGIQINEICTSNDNGIMDEFGQREDWIEIYNANDVAVNLAGLFLTDNNRVPTQYRIPEGDASVTTVPARGYLLFWCDGETNQGPLHTAFKLSKQGEPVSLVQQIGGELVVVDSVTVPSLSDDLTYGRDSSSGSWEFMGPTPLAVNNSEERKNLIINEFLTRNCGEWLDEYDEADDWIELYNPGPDTMDLAGLFLTDSLPDPLKYQIPFGSIDTRLSPGEYLVLWADNQPEQGVLHLDFRLDGNKEQIGLYQLGEGYIDSVSYTLDNSGVVLGRLADGTEGFQAVTATPGLPNSVRIVENLYINEFMAGNLSTSTDMYGEADDWIELYNHNNFPVDIGGLYLTDSLGFPGKFRIPDCQPEATTIPAGGFLLLWADGQVDQGPLHLGFKLNVDGEDIGLVQEDGKTIIDSLQFGQLYSDMAVGRINDGEASIRIVSATPGFPNQVRRSGKLYISEFSASGNSTFADASGEFDDWIEIYNGSDQAVDIGGYFLTDSLEMMDRFRISCSAPDSTTIDPGGYLILWADDQPEQGVCHLGFKLNGKGEQLALLDMAGNGIIDSVSFPDQHSHFTYSRDHNTGDWMFLRPTPGALNVNEPVQGIYINEFMASNTGILCEGGGYEDWIELYNSNEFPVDIGGLYLSDSAGDLSKFRIPSNSPEQTTIDPYGYIVFVADGDRHQGVNHTNFKLSRDGESIILSHYDAIQVLDSLTYARQYKNSASGRIPGTTEWLWLPATPGQENVIPDYSGLVINEVMGYNKTVFCDEYNEYDDWVELYNSGDAPVDIGGMYLSDSLADPMQFRISSEFPDSTTIPVGGHLILWADDAKEQGVLHLGFNISKTGETLGFFGHDGSLVDSVSYPFLGPNQSWGRVFDGDADWITYTVPTPEMSNLSTSINNFDEVAERLMVYPNPVKDHAIIRVSLNEPSEIIAEIIDSRGRICHLIRDYHPGGGAYDIEWIPDRIKGGLTESGLFLCRIRAGNLILTSRFILLNSY